ncbi:hypothetical protein C8034_v002582 [Colletotrichum sidae]|uniref:Uncharacterized protein n=1 Tax=Colletotrichum sidae TaxID=1347389 RepID=A0A4R8TBQ9_9PEZI|nr:hypothetical protein C8034_v002582 [Colletotrichum sidae]
MTSLESASARTPIAIPSINNDQLKSFFESHYSDVAVQTFHCDFLSHGRHQDDAYTTQASQDEGDYYEEDDDGLGYYPDGVKRTLTDEQIAMFRHSEIEALKKEQEKAAERQASGSQNLEAGEASETSPPPMKSTKNKKKRKAGKAKNREPKPDLRKRTWDVVEAGLDSLEYD